MAYQTYITPALVCGSRDNNTSDRSYLLFTREAGMLWASARSVREERSKNRYALQDFSLVRISLVHGKTGWKVTSVESVGNFYFDSLSRETRTTTRNMLRLLRRLLQGESAHPEVFDDIVVSLEKQGEVPEVLETVLTVRLLHKLGYVAPKKEYQSILEHAYAHEAIDTISGDEVASCRKSIKHALEMSHL